LVLGPFAFRDRENELKETGRETIRRKRERGRGDKHTHTHTHIGNNTFNIRTRRGKGKRTRILAHLLYLGS
jgi:hypothetical protein